MYNKIQKLKFDHCFKTSIKPLPHLVTTSFIIIRVLARCALNVPCLV